MQTISGMLFIFDQKAPREFWMKNVKIPLDILFVNDKKIVKIYKKVPICKESKLS